MTDTLRKKCELFERSHTAISKKFKFEKQVMSIASALIFTSADKEADVDRMKECRSILNRNTGVFSEYRDAVKLALISEMTLSADAERYLEDVKNVYQKLHKGHFKDNSYMVLAAMLLCDLGRQNDADTVIEKHNDIMQRMKKLHPFLTDSADISYVILLALSERTADAVISDTEACLEYLKANCKIGSDSAQGLSEILALTDGDIKEKCAKVITLYDTLKDKRTSAVSGSVFSALGMLINSDETPGNIIAEIIAADEYLKECKIFGKEQEDRSRRLMFAALLTASSCGTSASMVSSAFINTAFGIVKAQQIVAVLTVISNVLPAFLGAVTENKETDNKGTEKKK